MEDVIGKRLGRNIVRGKNVNNFFNKAKGQQVHQKRRIRMERLTEKLKDRTCVSKKPLYTINDDLINRNEVIKVIDELGYVNCHDGKDFEANNRVDKIRQRVVEMPTAYNVNKVLDRLENEKKPMHRMDGSLMDGRKLIEIDKAIEIVKYSGVIG